jgi:dipeptidyl aminopeptidase/acylaminoacyl peptidase
MRPVRFSAVVIIAALLASFAPFVADPVAATYPGHNGRILLSTALGGARSGIYTLRPGAAEWDLTPLLVSSTSSFHDPVWSPDGSMIALRRQISSTSHRLWVMRADGTGLRQVSSERMVGNPTWSPDGRRLAFAIPLADGLEVFTIGVDGTGLRRLSDGPGSAGYPQWSPTGDRIYYASAPAQFDPNNIYAIRPDGTDERRLTTVPTNSFSVSPDGSTLAFGAVVGMSFQVHLMPAGGGASTPITSHPSDNFPRAWSPDGSRILFTSSRFTDQGGLYSMTSSGGDTRPVFTRASTTGVDWEPRNFADARASIFRADIDWAFTEGVTDGCAPQAYCPDAPVTREQMASFLARALGLPATNRDFFTDDESSIHEGDINRVAAAGITLGCTAGRYCPRSPVSRQEMASFLVRGFHLPSTSIDRFTDDESSVHEADINRLAASGITTGCAPGRFCPGGSVTRGQKAAFLHRAMT